MAVLDAEAVDKLTNEELKEAIRVHDRMMSSYSYWTTLQLEKFDRQGRKDLVVFQHEGEPLRAYYRS